MFASECPRLRTRWCTHLRRVPRTSTWETQIPRSYVWRSSSNVTQYSLRQWGVTWCYIGGSRGTRTKKRHRWWGATWCYIGCFARDVFKQTCNASPPQGVLGKQPQGLVQPASSIGIRSIRFGSRVSPFWWHSKTYGRLIESTGPSEPKVASSSDGSPPNCYTILNTTTVMI